jgi:hypothetical protein
MGLHSALGLPIKDQFPEHADWLCTQRLTPTKKVLSLLEGEN